MLVLRGASYRYPSASAAALGPLDMRVEAGEMVLLTGPTGCGKSTLLRLAAGLLERHGHGARGGAVAVGGASPASLSPAERAAKIGFVSQEPADQIVSGTLGDELAFGLESVGWPPERIGAAVEEGLRRLGLPPEPDRSPRALSGGQRQRLVVAAALVAGAGLLLLDEPLSQLDPGGARDLLEQLRRTADGGVAVLMVEHRVEACLPWVDRVVVMEEGRIAADTRPEVLDLALLERLGLNLPALRVLAEKLGSRPSPTPRQAGGSKAAIPQGPPLIEISNLNLRYDAIHALRDVSLHVRPGERVALLGANGSGKSSLLGALSGRIRAAEVCRARRVVEVPQEADLSLFCETVRAELAYAPREQRCSKAEIDEHVQRAALGLSILGLLDRAPQALSRGQRARVAVAAALTVGAGVLLLDEPTAGQDRGQVERMMGELERALGPEAALVFATHDVDLALRHATRWVLLEGGRVLADGPAAALIRQLPAELPPPPLQRWLMDQGLPVAGLDEVLSWV